MLIFNVLENHTITIACYVIRRYGLPTKKGFERQYSIVPQTQDRATAIHQMGEVYAGDCGEV